MMTKIIAFYLPQYHCIPENDEWWGKGFTEWTNVKKSVPLFDNHNQPREPFEDNYYNLLDSNTIKWQVKIAKQYGIYGFCYYHYWFNGKMLLQKPAEILLQESYIDFPFCFCWANEPWTKTWNGTARNVIMEQVYGGESEWKKHFEYLLPFFKDKRYMKVNNKPIFIIYKTLLIPNCDEMIEYFNQLSKENNFNGIFAVEEVNNLQQKDACNSTAGVIEFEPGYTFNNSKKIILIVKKIYRWINQEILNKPVLFSYDKIWKKILKRNKRYPNKEKFMGAFLDWDNSPRRGRSSTIFKGVTAEKFEKYFSLQYTKACRNKDRFLFINAWNEWAEGTYLEPDKKNGFLFLETIKNIITKGK